MGQHLGLSEMRLALPFYNFLQLSTVCLAVCRFSSEGVCLPVMTQWHGLAVGYTSLSTGHVLVARRVPSASQPPNEQLNIRINARIVNLGPKRFY